MSLYIRAYTNNYRTTILNTFFMSQMLKKNFNRGLIIFQRTVTNRLLSIHTLNRLSQVIINPYPKSRENSTFNSY